MLHIVLKGRYVALVQLCSTGIITVSFGRGGVQVPLEAGGIGTLASGEQLVPALIPAVRVERRRHRSLIDGTPT